MNGILIRALLVSLITVSPIAVATAQETPPAEEKKVDPAKDDEQKKKAEEEKKEEPAPAEQPKEEPKAEQPKEEPKPAEQPKEEPKPAEQPAPAGQPAPAEQPKEEPKPAEQPQPTDQPAPAVTPPAAPIETTTPKETPAPTSGDAVASPQISATAESKPEDAAGKPWKVSAGLSFSVGSALLNKNPDIRKPSVGWLLDISGSYTLTKLLDGNLDVFGRITMDQVLTNTVYNSAVGQTKEYEFFFRDARLGLTSPGLYKEKVTGITISPSTEIFLPTSKASIAAERWFHFGLNLRLGRTFEKLGPGDLAFGLASTFRKPFSARHTDPERQADGDGTDVSNLCRSYAGDVQELAQLAHTDCGSGRNSNFTFINDASISYTWGPVTAGISYGIYSIRYHRGDLGPDLPNQPVGESRYASDNTWTNLTLGAISASYAINDNWTIASSLTTYQSPYFDDGKFRPPFWDPKGENVTTFDLGVTFVY